MDRYFPVTSEEFKAHAHIAEFVFWDQNIGAKDIGLCAAYASLSRFVKGEDLYLPPRNVSELEQILKLYSDHVINSLCSQVVSRVTIRQTNGYATAREQCARSLRSVLIRDDNLNRLIALHQPPAVASVAEAVTLLVSDVEDINPAASPRGIRTK